MTQDAAQGLKPHQRWGQPENCGGVPDLFLKFPVYFACQGLVICEGRQKCQQVDAKVSLVLLINSVVDDWAACSPSRKQLDEGGA